MSKDNFKWTRKLVEDFMFHEYGSPDIRKRVGDYERENQPKEPSKPEKERVVIDFNRYNANRHVFHLDVYSSKVIQENQFPLIKQAIEQVLNNEVEVGFDLMNKPCLSVHDVMSNVDLFSVDMVKLIELAKLKIK